MRQVASTTPRCLAGRFWDWHGAMAAAKRQKSQPSLNGGCNGREPTGRFTKGNNFGRGNPHGRRVNELRAVLFEVVTREKFRKAVTAQLTKAIDGDTIAFRELCDRMLGKPV